MNTHMTNMLLPCPFCGYPVNTDKLSLQKYKPICCSNLECPASPMTMGHLDNQTQIDSWNQRNKSVAKSRDGCLSCPFCGDYPDVQCDGFDPPSYYIQCLQCDVSTYACGDTKNEAISNWNTRVLSEADK